MHLLCTLNATHLTLVESPFFCASEFWDNFDNQIVQGFRSAFFKVRLVLIFPNTIVEKNIPRTLNFLFLYQFHVRKALFKVPKICNINLPPTPLWTFSKNSSDLVAGPFPYFVIVFNVVYVQRWVPDGFRLQF